MANDDKYAMSKADQNTLLSNNVYVIKYLHPEEALFIAHLMKHRILSENMNQRLQSYKTAQDTSAELLNLLPTRGPRAFRVFIDALMVSDQEYVARKLSEELVLEYIKKHPISTAVQESLSGGTTQFAASSGSMNEEVKYSMSYHTQPSSDDNDQQNEAMSYQSMKVAQVPCITHVDATNPVIRKLLDDKSVYKMSRMPRGRAIIVNMDQDRKGSATDLVDVSNLFKSLHFEIVHANNLSRKEMKQLIGDEITDSYHQKAEAFVMFVMAHGDVNTITCADGQSLKIDTQLVEPFHADGCPDLAGKPKMFFIQACQGDKGSGGIKMASDTSVISDSMVNLSLNENSLVDSRIHPMEDIIIEYATVPGYKAYRDTKSGSWFVQSLVEVFSQKAHALHLCDMLKQVREKVKQKGLEHQQKTNSAQTMQLTRTDDRSSKSLYFFPGYFSDK